MDSINCLKGGGSNNAPKSKDGMRINFDNNLRRWFSRSVGVWKSRRHYIFGDDKALTLEMFIKVEELDVENQSSAVYKFTWWGDKQDDFYKKKPNYSSSGTIEAELFGHQLLRNKGYMSGNPGISNIKQVDEHELIFESNYDDWHILEHSRLIDLDNYRSRVIFSWQDNKLSIVENHHDIRIE